MADSGRVVIYGYLGGMATPLPLVPLLRKALTLRAHSMFRTTLDAAAVARSVEYITRGVARGSIQPKVDRVFSLEQIVEAHRYLEASEQVGKIVVVP
jgi:NADPH2:quinone reductase